MSRSDVGLREAMALERELLEPIASIADLLIDTSRLGVHELRDIIHQRVEQRAAGRLSIAFESFGFKHGIPGDADFVFDARALPNPYWEPGLRNLTGRDPEVIRFLETHTHVERAGRRHRALRARPHSGVPGEQPRLPHVAVGCTGGQHRSVYIVDRLAEHFAAEFDDVTARHSGLPGSQAVPAAAARRAASAAPKRLRPLQVACATPGAVITLRQLLAAHEGDERGARLHRVAIAQLDQRARVAGLEHQVARELVP